MVENSEKTVLKSIVLGSTTYSPPKKVRWLQPHVVAPSLEADVTCKFKKSTDWAFLELLCSSDPLLQQKLLCRLIPYAIK